MDGPLLRRVGPFPVGPGLSVLPGCEAAPDPAGACVVATADQVVRAFSLERLAEDGRDEHRMQVDLERSAREMRAWAARDPAHAEGWTAEALRFERARADLGSDPRAIAGVLLEAHRARRALGAGRPLVIVGDHPGIGDALDVLVDEHPQVVHVPGA
ncbi:MAG: hypothetical protein MUE51_04280 [Thermoleophilia bacterium]|jgi:hypothetical protein|nr:hypothetical protein [Thermoleophilia bacterium]